MPPWLGTLIALSFVGALVGWIVYAMIRDRKRGKGGCSCGCEHCKMSCPTKQNKGKNDENKDGFPPKSQ